MYDVLRSIYDVNNINSIWEQIRTYDEILGRIGENDKINIQSILEPWSRIERLYSFTDLRNSTLNSMNESLTTWSVQALLSNGEDYTDRIGIYIYIYRYSLTALSKDYGDVQAVVSSLSGQWGFLLQEKKKEEQVKLDLCPPVCCMPICLRWFAWYVPISVVFGRRPFCPFNKLQNK